MEGEQLEDRRSVGVSSCNFGDGTDQRVQPLMFMMMMIMKFLMTADILKFGYKNFIVARSNTASDPTPLARINWKIFVIFHPMSM